MSRSMTLMVRGASCHSTTTSVLGRLSSPKLLSLQCLVLTICRCLSVLRVLFGRLRLQRPSNAAWSAERRFSLMSKVMKCAQLPQSSSCLTVFSYSYVAHVYCPWIYLLHSGYLRTVSTTMTALDFNEVVRVFHMMVCLTCA